METLIQQAGSLILEQGAWGLVVLGLAWLLVQERSERKLAQKEQRQQSRETIEAMNGMTAAMNGISATVDKVATSLDRVRDDQLRKGAV